MPPRRVAAVVAAMAGVPLLLLAVMGIPHLGWFAAVAAAALGMTLRSQRRAGAATHLTAAADGTWWLHRRDAHPQSVEILDGADFAAALLLRVAVPGTVNMHLVVPCRNQRTSQLHRLRVALKHRPMDDRG